MISRVASEVSFLEFYQRGVTDGVRTQIVSRDSQHVTLRVL